MTIDFKFTDLIPPGTNIDFYFKLDREFIRSGFATTIYVVNPELDYASEET